MVGLLAIGKSNRTDTTYWVQSLEQIKIRETVVYAFPYFDVHIGFDI